MLYLSGAVRKGMGAMLTPRMRQLPPDGEPWAADTGRYASPADYADETYLAWLGRMDPYRARCLFATAPDVVGDATMTLQLSRPMLPRIRAAGYAAALVGQDGLDPAVVPWDDVDAYFIGGTTSWKGSERSRELAHEARSRGKWVHMGRVNSYRRLRMAQGFGCDSADGTFIAFGPDRNEPRVRAWLAQIHRQLGLW